MSKRGGETRNRNKRTSAIRSEGKALSNGVLLVLMALGFIGVFMLLRPFFAPIVLALFLVTMSYPVHKRVRRLFKGRKTITAVVMVIGVFLVVVIPFLLVSAAIVQQGIEVAQQLQNWISSGGPKGLVEGIQNFNWERYAWLGGLRNFIEDRIAGMAGEKGTLTEGLAELSSTTAQALGSFILPLLSQTGLLIMNFFIMFFIMFYAFRDGDAMLSYFLKILPLSGSHEEVLIKRVRYIVRAVLLGMLLTAAVQAVVASIGFQIIGISALFWGVMLGISSFIPIVGTALVWVPITGYMLITGKIGYAIFIFIWCAVGVGSIDNFLRPYLMQGKSGMSTLILFFALIGGIRLFGPIGILYGPMIFGLLAVILYIYTLQHSQALLHLERQ
ncbi:MAG: AI-2E family transporter [Spirochaetia bacterium]